MKIEKKILGQLDKAYATTIMEIDGQRNYLVATEGYGPCERFGQEFGKLANVWDGPGGTMNIVPVPGRKNEFFATQDFTPTFQAQESKIVYAKYEGSGSWSIKSIMTVPYLHRFDVFCLGQQLYFIGATLCEGKEYKEDWSKPGKVYIGKIAEPIGERFSLEPVLEGITKNHGFCRGVWNKRDAYLVSGTEGVFVIYLPEKDGGKWETEQIMDHEVSDIAVVDLDNDGQTEMAVIEPFHGSRGVIYKKISGRLVPVYEHEYEFGHVVWGGTIANKPAFIIGGRKGTMELNCFQVDENGEIKYVTIDNTGGPSNIAVISLKDSELILAANRQIGEIAVYKITK
jgi:hypothetical protein